MENIRNEYMAALQREHALAAAVAQQKTEVDRVNLLLIEHNILKREFDSNQQLYDNLLQRLKDATVSAGLQATNIHIVDEAPIPTYPVRPNKLRNIEFALAAGLALGIALALTKEALGNSIQNAQEMEKLTGRPGDRSLMAIRTATPLQVIDRNRGACSGDVYGEIGRHEEAGGRHFRGLPGAADCGSAFDRRTPT